MRYKIIALLSLFLYMLLMKTDATEMIEKKKSEESLNKFMNSYGVSGSVEALDMEPKYFIFASKNVQKELFLTTLQIKNEMNAFIRSVILNCENCSMSNILKREKLEDFIKYVRLNGDIYKLKKNSEMINIASGSIYYSNVNDKKNIINNFLKHIKNEKNYRLAKEVAAVSPYLIPDTKNEIKNGRQLLLIKHNVSDLFFLWEIGHNYQEIFFNREGISFPGELKKIAEYKKIRSNLFTVNNFIIQEIMNNEGLLKKIGSVDGLSDFSKSYYALAASALTREQDSSKFYDEIDELHRKAELLLKKIFLKADGAKWFVENIPLFSLFPEEKKGLLR